MEKAKNIDHGICILNNELHLNSFYSFPKKDKIRDQEVYIFIEIPTNKTVKIKDEIISIDFETQRSKSDSFEVKGYLERDGEYECWN